jgi:hypothetical protein
MRLVRRGLPPCCHSLCLWVGWACQLPGAGLLLPLLLLLLLLLPRVLPSLLLLLTSLI